MTEWPIIGQATVYLLLIWCLIALRTITTSTRTDETTRRTIMAFITIALLITVAIMMHWAIAHGGVA
jgi:succinate dehydrogenase hydrophobic anchor subunit